MLRDPAIKLGTQTRMEPPSNMEAEETPEEMDASIVTFGEALSQAVAVITAAYLDRLNREGKDGAH